MGVLCAWVKLLTDLQMLGCELHKNAFGGRTRWRAIALPDLVAVIRRDGRNGKERVGNREGRKAMEGQDVKAGGQRPTFYDCATPPGWRRGAVVSGVRR